MNFKQSNASSTAEKEIGNTTKIKPKEKSYFKLEDNTYRIIE